MLRFCVSFLWGLTPLTGKEVSFWLLIEDGAPRSCLYANNEAKFHLFMMVYVLRTSNFCWFPVWTQNLTCSTFTWMQALLGTQAKLR